MWEFILLSGIPARSVAATFSVRSPLSLRFGMASPAAAADPPGPWRRKQRPQPRYRCFVQVDETTYSRLLASNLPAPLKPFGNEPERQYHGQLMKTATIDEGAVHQVEWDRQKRPCLIAGLKRPRPPRMDSIDGPTLESMLRTLDGTCRKWLKDYTEDGLVLDDSLFIYQMTFGTWQRSKCLTLKAQLPTALYLWAMDRLAPPPLSEPSLPDDQQDKRVRVYEERRRHDMNRTLAFGPGLTNSAERPVVSGSGGGVGDVGISGGGGSGAVSAAIDALANTHLSTDAAAPGGRPGEECHWFRLPDELQLSGGGAQSGVEFPPCTLMGYTTSPIVCLLRPLAKGASPTPDDELWTASEVYGLMEAVEKLAKARQWPLGLTSREVWPEGGPDSDEGCAPSGHVQAAGDMECSQAGGDGPPGYHVTIVPCLE